MLCKFCANINLDALDSFDGYNHHPSVKSLQDSALNGCESCALIRSTHREYEGGLLQEPWCGSAEDTQITMRSEEFGMIEVAQIERRKHQKPETQPFLNCIVHVCAEADDPLAVNILRRPVNLPLATGDYFRTASNWLQACRQHHEYCKIGEEGLQPLPTRVIDVGPPDGSKAPFLFRSNGRSGQWVTLSHCWGQKEPLKTTSAVVAMHEDSLPMQNLPPLFRDAVIITRKLGFRYLWIDSLCIIQDSKADWQIESTHMGDVYSNAVFTIAAEAASSCEEGILNNPHLPVSYPVKIPCRSDTSDGHVILYRARHDSKGPLGKRAWTLQEDILSARVLRWGTKQLSWHCRTATCSEHDPTEAFNIDPKGYSSYERLYRQPDYKLLCLSKEALQTHLRNKQAPGANFDCRVNVLSLWNSIVQDFTSRSLTYDTDRLPALSGVAKAVVKHTGYNYIAGLWREEIHSDLMWRTEGTVEYPSTYTAPSWTWAGCKLGPGKSKLATMGTKFRHNESNLVADVIAVNLTYLGPDSYGQLSSGKLVLRTSCLEIPNYTAFSSRFDCFLDGDPPSSALCVQILNFPTRKWFSALRGQHFEGEICCLLLAPAMDTRASFRRIGTARIPMAGHATETKMRSQGQWVNMFRNAAASEVAANELWNSRTVTII